VGVRVAHDDAIASGRLHGGKKSAIARRFEESSQRERISASRRP
jgi:hypothetical protein